MRVIDKLAKCETEGDLLHLMRGDVMGDLLFGAADGAEILSREVPLGVLARRLLAEVEPEHKIGVRLIFAGGGVSTTVYTYLVKGEKPHPGSIVKVPRPRGKSGVMWGIVQTEAALRAEPEGALKHIIEWVHRYSEAEQAERARDNGAPF